MIALVHLSDIHFKLRGHNAVVERRRALSAAVASACRDASAIVVVVSGDIAHSGRPEEYALARSFFVEMKNDLANTYELKSPIILIGTPGNHDCDHSRQSQLRIAAIDRDLTGARPDAGTLDIAMNVLSPYSDFARTMFAAGSQSSHQLVEFHVVADGPRRVVLATINAAWCSVNPEEYGKLWLPHEAIKAIAEANGDINIAVVHFPLNWFDYQTRHELGRTVDTAFQLVLTGHEHSSRQFTIGSETYQCERIEGGELQDDKSSNRSHFTVALVNSNSMQLTVIPFSWNSTTSEYLRDNKTPEARALVRRRAGAHGSALEMLSVFSEQLDEMDLPLTHPNPRVRRISDLFVWPDITTFSGRSEAKKRTTSTREWTSLTSGALLLAGSERSGKTAVGKVLLRHWHSEGWRGLWVDCRKFERKLVASVDAAVDAAVEAQYGGGTSQSYSQLPPREKAVVLDDFHLLPPDVDRETLLRGLTDRFGLVLVLVNEDWLIEQTASRDRLPALFSFRIGQLLPFGPRLRHDLVTSWVQHIPSLRSDPVASERRIEEMSGLLDGLVGHDLVPPYPSSLLVMLQTLQAQGITDVNHGSLGHTYHMLVHSRVAQGVSPTQTNMRMRYLTELAWSLFESGGRPWSRPFADAWHRQYVDRFGLGNDADHLLNDLKLCGLLDDRGGEWHFRHKYVYFYFVAEHIQQHLHDERMKSVLASLVLRLQSEDATNIFSLVAFKSRDRLVLDLLLQRARALFSESRECDISRDCASFDAISTDVPQLVLEHERRDEIRRAVLDDRDDHDRRLERSYSARDVQTTFADDDSLIQKLISSLRLVTVIGQVVRNHAGQLEADRMRELVSCAYSLSMRSLSVFLDAADSERAALVSETVKALKEKNVAMSVGELQSKVSRRLAFLIELATFGLVKHVGNSVGMGEMVERTLAAVRASSTNTSVELIDLSVELDRSRRFPRARVLGLAGDLRGKAFALSVLRLMCMTNFYLFSVPEQDRQSVCDTLGISQDQKAALSSRAKRPGPRLIVGSRFKQRPKKRQ